jgi:hypothetical protein
MLAQLGFKYGPSESTLAFASPVGSVRAEGSPGSPHLYIAVLRMGGISGSLLQGVEPWLGASTESTFVFHHSPCLQDQARERWCWRVLRRPFGIAPRVPSPELVRHASRPLELDLRERDADSHILFMSSSKPHRSINALSKTFRAAYTGRQEPSKPQRLGRVCKRNSLDNALEPDRQTGDRHAI